MKLQRQRGAAEAQPVDKVLAAEHAAVEHTAAEQIARARVERTVRRVAAPSREALSQGLKLVAQHGPTARYVTATVSGGDGVCALTWPRDATAHGAAPSRDAKWPLVSP